MSVSKGHEMMVVAYHGTDRMDFARFDIAETRSYNVGLHFGTRTAAKSRIAFLRERNPPHHFAFSQKLNVELRRLFPKLSYDGFVYTNEFEDVEFAADSHSRFVK